jgi:hypothetical protein
MSSECPLQNLPEAGAESRSLSVAGWPMSTHVNGSREPAKSI